METRVCTKCGEEKPATREYFYRANNRLRGDCKKCTCLWMKHHQEQNSEKIKERKKKYREQNSEKIKERKKKYREQNPEKVQARSRKYYEKNKEKIKERKKKYREQNPEKIRLRNKTYYENNREKILEYQSDEYNKMPAGIYRLTNNKTGMIYIGQSAHLPARWNQHKSKLRRQKHGNFKIQDDYNKYGLDVFEFEILKEYPPGTQRELLEKIEEETIKRLLSEGKKLYNEILFSTR